MEHHTYLHISSAYTNQMPHLSHIIHHEYTRCRARHSRHLTLNSTPSNWELCTAQKKSRRRRRSFSPLDSIQTFTFIRLLCRYFVYKFKWVRHTTGNVIFTKKKPEHKKSLDPKMRRIVWIASQVSLALSSLRVRLGHCFAATKSLTDTSLKPAWIM